MGTASQIKYGVALVHGFTGSPFEVRLLGDSLARAYPSLEIEIPTLAGHGADVGNFASTRWPDWSATVDRAVDRLRGACDRIAIVGLSLGGLLTLEFGTRRPDDAVALVSLSAPLWVSPRIARTVHWVKRVPLLSRASIPLFGGSDISDPVMKRRNDAVRVHKTMPMGPLVSLLDLMQALPSKLSQVTRPLLLMHARQDHTAPFGSMDFIYERVSSQHRDKVALERSFHVITLDVERELVFARVREHLDRHLFQKGVP